MGKRFSDTEIRPAQPDEADALVALHQRSYEAAFREVVARDVFGDDLPAARAERWRASLERGEPTLVAEREQELVGLAVATRSPHDGSVGEIRLLYVAPEAWGTGVGRTLLDACENALRDDGFAAAVLWVLEENRRARRFYEGAGWLVDGDTRAEEETGLAEVRYRKRL